MPEPITITAPGALADLAMHDEPADISAAEVPFADADSAARWLKSLPLTSVSQLTAVLLKELKAMTPVDYAPRERARIAEILREQVAHLHTELARRYAGKPQPSGEREQEALDQAIGLWHGLWEQYSACLKPLLNRDPELEGVKAKLLQRGLYVGKQLVLVHGLARRAVPPSVWQEIHAYYRIAELLDCTGAAISDELLPNASGISCYGTYSHALLLELADPCALSVKQIELTDRWLQMWSRKVFPYPHAREDESPVLLVDLDSGTGARLASTRPDNAPPSLRFGYPAKLATSVRGRLKRLQSGADPAELQLGRDCGIEQGTVLLSHLDARWYQLPRSAPATLQATLAVCGGGLHAAYFRVGGRTFERTDPLASPASHRLALETLGAVADYDRGRDDAERRWPWEDWAGTCEPREAVLTSCATPLQRWFLEQLVTVRDGTHVRIGYVVRVARRQDELLQLTLRLFSGKPRALALRPLTTTLAEDPPIPCLILPESHDDKASMLVPPRTFGPSRTVRTMQGAPERAYRLTRLLHRGADFERVAFEEIA